ncbi:hypothetical protein GCM10022224_055720 [Nonomuraea antimicrobica]|uniref:Uncharacterized protein n=1 Tax=Nonomuraea antimicrobica TaxID=561173 RepID=A0ABP7CD34_9ACTN
MTALTLADAMDLLVRRRLEQTRRQLTVLNMAWDVLTELTEEHRSGRPVQMVEHIPDGPAITRRLRAMPADDPGELTHLKIRARSATSGYDDTPFRRLLARGLHSRTLFPAQALADPDQEPYARYCHALSDLHRVTTEPIRHLAIVNRRVAFVQANPADPQAGALHIRQPGVVAMLADVFDGTFGSTSANNPAGNSMALIAFGLRLSVSIESRLTLPGIALISDRTEPSSSSRSSSLSSAVLSAATRASTPHLP